MILSRLLGAVSLSACLALSSLAHANDSRLVTRLYNPDSVVRLEGRVSVQATIAFGDDEHIENVAVGDSESWQITPNKRANLLFVKPLSARARTNMTVVTDRHTYLFDLVAGGNGTPVYVLRFAYPEGDKPKVEPQMATALTSEEQGSVQQAPVDPADLNFAWTTRGASKLLPSRIYDDGLSTYLSWSPGVAIPAIQIRDDKGVEGPVNYASRGDVIVVEGVPNQLILRAGRDTATLENKATPRKPTSETLASATPLAGSTQDR